MKAKCEMNKIYYSVMYITQKLFILQNALSDSLYKNIRTIKRFDYI